MSSADETVVWRKAREVAVPEKGGLTLAVPGGGDIFFRKIPAGRFLMGARGENENEEPRTVQVAHFFL